MQAQHLRLPAHQRAVHRHVALSARSRNVLRPLAAATDSAPATAAGNSTDLGAKMSNVKIAVFSAKGYVVDFMEEPVKGVFPNTTFIEAALDLKTAPLAKGYDVVCLFVNDNADEKVMARLKEDGVKLIAMRCAGFDRVDVKAAKEQGIKVVRVPTYSPTSVAEHAVALMFCLNRSLHQAHARVLQGNYALSGLVGFEMFGKTVGILGTGAIGAEAVRICHGIGMKVLAYDIRHNPKVEALGVPYMDIDEILPQADIVSVHVPLMPSTYHFIDKDKISKMKQGAYLINVSRGGLVDTDAVIEGLEDGTIGGLGMDVYENEASLFFTDWTTMDRKVRMAAWDRRFKTLLSFPQTMFTPHSAFLTHEALENIASTTVANIKAYLAGEELKNEVKPQE